MIPGDLVPILIRLKISDAGGMQLTGHFGRMFRRSAGRGQSEELNKRLAAIAAVLGPWRQTGPQIGRISHRLLILGAGRLEGLAGQPIGVQNGKPVWRDGAALGGRAFRLLEDFATRADAVHLAAAGLNQPANAQMGAIHPVFV